VPREKRSKNGVVLVNARLSVLRAGRANHQPVIAHRGQYLQEEVRMFQVVLVVMCVLLGVPAFGQSAYITGAVGLEVLRSDQIEAPGVTGQATNGESVAFSLGVGTAITDRWGVEIALTQPSEIEREGDRRYPIPLLTRAVPVGLALPDPAIPIVQSRVRLERRNTTLDAVAWALQAVSDRVDLVYLGGVAFSRVTERQEFDFIRRSGPVAVPALMRTITYGVGPVVGVDARLKLTEHARLVPGVRLHAIDGNAGGGWLFRSSVGLGWTF
jgi:hypothetical protein